MLHKPDWLPHRPPPHLHPHLGGRANLGPERFLNSHGKKDSQAREQAAPVALRAQETAGTPANTRLAASTHIPGWHADPPERTPGRLTHRYTPDHARLMLAHVHARTERGCPTSVGLSNPQD